MNGCVVVGAKVCKMGDFLRRRYSQKVEAEV